MLLKNENLLEDCHFKTGLRMDGVHALHISGSAKSCSSIYQLTPSTSYARKDH